MYSYDMIYLFGKSLTQLDLSHNYLRAVTSDLVDGLPSLESLDLTDNDISLVEPGALTNLPKLIHLSLTGKRLLFSFIYSYFGNLFSYIYKAWTCILERVCHWHFHLVDVNHI